MLAATLRVATLSPVLTEFAARIGGDRVTVAGVLRPGVDPHTFEPSPRDMAALTSSSLVLFAGLDAGERLSRLALRAHPGVKIVDLWPGEADPHWWNSARRSDIVADRLAAALEAALPAADRPAVAARAGRLSAELRQLDTWARAELAAIPPGHRVLVTNHDAFHWFGVDYGFRIQPLSGFNPGAEPSARALAQVEDALRASGTKAVFLEAGANPRLLETLAEDAGARIGGELYADGLSPSGEGATYAGMFRHNLRTLAAGLK